MNKHLITPLLLVLALPLSPGCGRSGRTAQSFATYDIEVAPGVFATVEDRSSATPEPAPMAKAVGHSLGLSYGNYSESTELRIQWQGTNVYWKGNSIPVTLRAHEGKLYLIAWDRLTRGYNPSKGVIEPIFRCYAQQADQLKEIQPVSFPKAVAGQNGGFLGGRYFMSGDTKRDQVQIARDMDPSDYCFRTSITAYLWNHLSTGQQYYESYERWEIDRTLLEDYIRKNQPIKLTFTNYFAESVSQAPGAGNTNDAAPVR